VTPSDASVSFDIDGLPVVLVLPERCYRVREYFAKKEASK